MSIGSRRWGAVLLASATVAAGGCDASAPNPAPSASAPATPVSQFPNWPSELDNFRFHWSAAPGIDLGTSPAVALRAYLESYRVVMLTNGITTNAYPGFGRATPENVPRTVDADTLLQLTGVRPRSRAEAEATGWKYSRQDMFGYDPMHVLALEPAGDGYRATVCVGWYADYRHSEGDPTKYVSNVADPKTGELQFGDWQLVGVWRVELTDKDPRTASMGPSPTVPQIGPLPAPTGDVFGRWFITGASTGLWGPTGSGENIRPPEIQQQCENAMPDDAATRKAMGTGFHDQPPPHGDPIPGWPAESR